MSSTNPDERRTAIIRAVWQVIAEHGMGAVSMRNVAAAAGVSVGQIQYWFTSKDELLRAGLETMVSGAAQLHDTATEHADDRETLWQLIGQSIPRAESSSAGVSVFHQYIAAAINHPALARILAEAKNGAESEVARLLAGIAPELPDPHIAARALMATADGLTMRVLIGSLSATEAERALRLAVERFTN